MKKCKVHTGDMFYHVQGRRDSQCSVCGYSKARWDEIQSQVWRDKIANLNGKLLIKPGFNIGDYVTDRSKYWKILEFQNWDKWLKKRYSWHDMMPCIDVICEPQAVDMKTGMLRPAKYAGRTEHRFIYQKNRHCFLTRIDGLQIKKPKVTAIQWKQRALDAELKLKTLEAIGALEQHIKDEQ